MVFERIVYILAPFIIHMTWTHTMICFSHFPCNYSTNLATIFPQIFSPFNGANGKIFVTKIWNEIKLNWISCLLLIFNFCSLLKNIFLFSLILIKFVVWSLKKERSKKKPKHRSTRYLDVHWKGHITKAKNYFFNPNEPKHTMRWRKAKWNEQWKN